MLLWYVENTMPTPYPRGQIWLRQMPHLCVSSHFGSRCLSNVELLNSSSCLITGSRACFQKLNVDQLQQHLFLLNIYWTITKWKCNNRFLYDCWNVFSFKSLKKELAARTWPYMAIVNKLTIIMDHLLSNTWSSFTKCRF